MSSLIWYSSLQPSFELFFWDFIHFTIISVYYCGVADHQWSHYCLAFSYYLHFYVVIAHLLS
jgi:hypothetical protein